MKKVFQITLKGFDGSTDKTDDHILWIAADSIEDVDNWCQEHPEYDIEGIDETDLPPWVDGVDVTL